MIGQPRLSPLAAGAALTSILTLLACSGRPQGATPGEDPAIPPTGIHADTPYPTRYDLAYTIAMPNPASHLFHITIDIGDITADTLRLQLPVWSPGRYAKMDFARNVQDFAVTAANDRPVGWDKENGSLWRVHAGGARSLRVRYRMYANTLSGTFSVLDTAHANWNGPSMFMYVDGQKPNPVRLRIEPPRGWQVINGHTRTPGQLDYRFANYDEMVDTPTEVARNLAVDTFSVDGILFRSVVHYNGGPPPATEHRRFTRDVERIVRTQHRVLGPPPIDMYTFLFNIGYAGGDGMEHLNSTQVISSGRWTDTAVVLPAISTASHEYFHTWNMKRLRAAALGPFDYTREQYQTTLWVGEGWTNYYGNITLHRSGIVNRERYYQMLANVIRITSESPGRKEVSPRMASFHAPFWDGAAPPMETNRANTFVSYYTSGESRAAFLDLHIRGLTRGEKSLDDVLRLLRDRMWNAPSESYYLQGRGYTEADVERAASDVAGVNLSPWFDRYAGGTEDLPWHEALRVVGLRLEVRPAAVGTLPSYTITEEPGATAEQRRLREAWLRG